MMFTDDPDHLAPLGVWCGPENGDDKDGARDGDRDGETPGGGTGTDVAVRPKEKTKKPSLYRVLLLNDDYTPMEFVVFVLERFFNLTHGRAVEIMLQVHNQGLAVVGVYPFEVAETKVTQVMDCARSNQHPLQCT
ncbi:MAG: ATP-dependent Clp protease adapter ClpS, partial [Pseudomonadota bacterium]